MSQEALEGLLKALPRCCNCQTAAAVVIDFYRWPLCERCWRAVPGSDDEPPSADMREAVRAAQKAFRISLTDSLYRIPSVNEIPPSSAPPNISYPVEELKELETSLRMARRRYREQKAASKWAIKKMAVLAFLLGIFLSSIVFSLLK